MPAGDNPARQRSAPRLGGATRQPTLGKARETAYPHPKMRKKP